MPDATHSIISCGNTCTFTDADLICLERATRTLIDEKLEILKKYNLWGNEKFGSGFPRPEYTETIKQRHTPFPGMGTPQPVIKWSKKAEITKCALRCQAHCLHYRHPRQSSLPANLHMP